MAAAKQYHCIRPNDGLAVFDSQSSLGGTWADERLHPGLKSNNLLGTYEYPDFPMESGRFKVQPGEHIPGDVVNAYLKAYAIEFGIHDYIRLGTRVTSAEHQPGGGWILTAIDAKGEECKVFSRRLIVATGLTSEPFIPHIKGQETFGGAIFHGKDFLQNRDTLETAKSIAIVGGSKFSWDAVYSFAKAGVKVHWVIRGTAASNTGAATPADIAQRLDTGRVGCHRHTSRPLRSGLRSLQVRRVPRAGLLLILLTLPVCRHAPPDMVQPVHMGRRRRLSRRAAASPRHCRWKIHG